MELIDRKNLKEKLSVIEGVTQKDKPNFIWKSVYKTIDDIPEYVDPHDCNNCFITSPVRLWKSVDKEMPTIRKKVLVRAHNGAAYIAFYMSKCWWVEHPDLGDISHFFKDNPVVEWREIE